MLLQINGKNTGLMATQKTLHIMSLEFLSFVLHHQKMLKFVVDTLPTHYNGIIHIHL